MAAIPQLIASRVSAEHPVGVVRQSMSDEAREQAIKVHAALMTAAMEEAENDTPSYFYWRGVADRERLQMEELIRGRSKGQVFILEAKRGLV